MWKINIITMEKKLKVINKSSFDFSNESISFDQMKNIVGGDAMCLCNKNAFIVTVTTTDINGDPIGGGPLCVCNKNPFLHV
jgi:hypothetical protein